MARIQLGQRLRNRRLDLRLTPKEVAAAISKTPQSYGDVERGLKSFEDIRVWIKIAIALQLNRQTLLEQAWDTRDGFVVPLPAVGDPRRVQLVQIASEIFGAGLPEQL
jgi:transcriptional regulator with XRE-family HTH domain